ncbi:YceI family protein [Runella sp.]|uniref:YceI family protein n=1 Tax=Runella sp. TaxID=1960881 RepID=UPI003D0B21AD
MKKLLLAVLIGMGRIAVSQDVFIARNGETSFFSETPLENISALNKNVTALLNVKTGEMVVKMQTAQFVFPNKLMEEHFNENYMESDKYPTATFSGKLVETIDFSKEGTYQISAKGILLMHGVKKERTLDGKLTVAKTGLLLTCDFNVPLTDHKIEVPKLVFEKIAEVIAVKTKFSFIPFTKN